MMNHEEAREQRETRLERAREQQRRYLKRKETETPEQREARIKKKREYWRKRRDLFRRLILEEKARQE